MIAHIDMDAFFARCEELRNPELEEKPVVICMYTRNETSGAVSTSNYRARELGINSGMPLSEARNKASEETVFLPADHDYYRQKSEDFMSVVRSHSSTVQKTSIDEAYLRLKGEPEQKAKKIKAKIESKGLSASIGLAPNKFLAKLASEEDKPDGLHRVTRDEAEDFLRGKDIKSLHGVGGKTASKLREIGLTKVEDLREVNSARLAQELGRKKAAALKAKAKGKGSTELENSDRKQLSKIKTMERNSRDPDYIMKELEVLAESLEERIERKDIAFKGVTVIGIDRGMDTLTRSSKINTSDSSEEIISEAEKLLEKLLADVDTELRRVGLRVSDLVDTGKQAKLNSF